MLTVHEFNFGISEKVSCIWDEKLNKMWLQYNGKNYDNFSEFLKQTQKLLNPENLSIYSQLINFIHTGVSFSYIQDTEFYKTSYAEWIKTLGTEHPHPCTNFGPFNLSEIQSPKILDGKLIFYVQDNYTNVPFRVESSYPFDNANNEIFYNLLPYLSISQN